MTQITAEGVAWFWMSEGSANIYIHRRKIGGRTYTLLPEASIANTDKDMLDALALFLDRQKINYYRCSTRIRLNCSNVRKFLIIIYPWLVGKKLKVANLVFRFFKEVHTPAGKTMAWSRGEQERFLKGVEIYKQIALINSGKIRKDLDQIIRYALQKRDYPYVSLIKTCEYCKEQFRVYKNRKNTARFCSMDCRKKSGSYVRSRTSNYSVGEKVD